MFLVEALAVIAVSAKVNGTTAACAHFFKPVGYSQHYGFPRNNLTVFMMEGFTGLQQWTVTTRNAEI